MNFNNYNNEFEKEVLNKLVKRQGFNKVFNILSKPCFDRNNPLEKKLDEIICNIGLLRTSLILLQIKFDMPPPMHNYNGYNTNPYYNPPNPYLMSNSNSNPYLNQSYSYNSGYHERDLDILLDDNKDYKREDESKYKRVQERKEIEKEGYELGEHLHKEADGKIYKYLKHHLRVTKGFVFN